MEGYRYCPRCGTEYRAGFDRCADCDVLLVDDVPELSGPTAAQRPTFAVDPAIDLVEVYSSPGPDVDIVRSYLEGHGIRAIAVGEDAGMYTLTVGPMAVRRILVRSTDVADAQTLIGDAQVDGRLPVDEEPDEPAPDRSLGFSSFVLVAVALVIVVGIVVAYMPGSG